MSRGFFGSFSGVLDWIVLILVWFERSLHSAQVSQESCPWPLKLMTSQWVERTWIRTGGYGRFRGEWVNFIKTMSHDLLVQMNLDMMPWNSASGRFAYIWQRKWVGITAIKTQKTQIHFFSDFLVAVASLDLKVPIGVFLHVPTNSSRSLCESSLGPVSLWFLKWQIAATSAKAFCFSRNVSGGCSRSWTGVFTSSVSAYHSTKSRSERCTRQTAQN